VPPSTKVLADPSGLLQVLLNLAQNSFRAVQQSPSKEFAIQIKQGSGRVLLSVCDSGPGVPSPERLFRPFDSDVEGSGLGLYISRTVLRGFGGDLRFEPRDAGCCFLIELQSSN
jgi:C4-dicarboxylate-specific signal transduction histidine kinase